MNYKYILLAIICSIFVSCLNTKPENQKAIIVKVPPHYNKNLSAEENFWRFQKFLFPQIEIPTPIPKGLPNDNSFLFISIDKNKSITLNSQKISDEKHLQAKLEKHFAERKKNRVFEPHKKIVIKAIGIKADFSVKYVEVLKVIEAIEQSGARPIVLLFDNDARPKGIFNLSTGKEIKNNDY